MGGPSKWLGEDTWNWTLGLVYIVAVATIWIAASYIVQSVVDAGDNVITDPGTYVVGANNKDTIGFQRAWTTNSSGQSQPLNLPLLVFSTTNVQSLSQIYDCYFQYHLKQHFRPFHFLGLFSIFRRNIYVDKANQCSSLHGGNSNIATAGLYNSGSNSCYCGHFDWSSAPKLMDYVGAAIVMVGFAGINIPSDTFCKPQVMQQEQEAENASMVDHQHSVLMVGSTSATS
ncbi:hypothetical protein J5N97_016717 [Dioscorea zingiberensis]|uniref:Uncharacterized protein n=1 Tax=Dioscorea zingiberensis TaxID=325984 RepID=A0A9D5CKE4_9LILI|nr:hypothetical protein J5N97_016717 [Dioscorea zingiberensis]